jgi:REP element-mobilizing transposase RayT
MTFDSLNDDSHLFFITASVCGWKPLLAQEKYSRIVLEGLDTYRRNSTILLFAFVIMPTHLHTIIKPLQGSIGQFLQKFGSFTAHRMVKELKQSNSTDLLDFFHQSRRDPRSKHSIWQDIQSKNIYSIEFLAQKLEYIHNNPVGGKWNLFKNRTQYPLSSAMYYDLGKLPTIEVDDIRDFLTATGVERPAGHP